MVRKAVEGGGRIAVGPGLWGHPWSGDGDFPHLSRGWTTWLKRGVPRNELIRLIRGLSNRDISIRLAISRAVAVLFATNQTIITLDDFWIRCCRVGQLELVECFFLRFEWSGGEWSWWWWSWRDEMIALFQFQGLVRCERLRWFRRVVER